MATLAIQISPRPTNANAAVATTQPIVMNTNSFFLAARMSA